MIKILSFCKSYLKKHIVALSTYILLCTIVGLFSLVKPYITGSFLDYLSGKHREFSLVHYCIFFFCTTVLSIVVGYVTNRLFVYLQTKLGFELNRDMISHVHKLPLSYLEKQDTAYLNQRINNDSNAIITFCIGIIQNIIIKFVTLIISLTVIFSFDPFIALVLFVLVPSYYVMYRLLKKYIFSASFLLKEQQADYFGKLYEQFSNIKLLKIHSISDEFLKRLNITFNMLLKSVYKYQNTTYLFSGLDSIVIAIAHVFLFLYGGFLVVSNELTIGQFTIISSYFGIMLAAARYFFSLGKTIQDNLVSLTRLDEILSIKQNLIGDTRLHDINDILISNYSKNYNENNVISNFSFRFGKGNIYTISGTNGSGKTTIINSILGLDIDEYSGNIYINGVLIQSINMQDARERLFGVVEQEPLLFNDTISYNIWLGKSEDEHRENYYIDLLGLHYLIESLPAGLQTIISENSSNLSGGEKQKISIIRALVKDPEVIILDEPTSALDKESSEKLKMHLLSIKSKKIIIIISHDTIFHDISDVVISLS